ncbi:zinc finger protein 729-like [Ornithodoros turicata]|uniref:zinc finger protein 729-like n=1 Tax=Ornithodoros turicata TaxID=34597 RepID=UPI003138D68C
MSCRVHLLQQPAVSQAGAHRQEAIQYNPCPAEFVKTTNFRHQKQTHTGPKPYKCDLCPAEFTHGNNLRYHRQVHTGRKPYKCDFCPAEFVKTTNLHTLGQKPYKCDLCPAEFTHGNNLRYHRQVHTGRKPYKCDFCPAEFVKTTNLHTLGQKPYKCDLCPAEFTHGNNLRYHRCGHTGAVHTGRKPYKCDFCPAEFVKTTNKWHHSNSLQYHKHVYTGKKPYKCDLCPAGCTQARSRTSVTSVLHSSSRPQTCGVTSRQTQGKNLYKCDLCHADFTYINSLRYHKQVHTAEFTHSNNLRYHKQVHTGKKPYQCDFYPAEFVKATNLVHPQQQPAVSQAGAHRQEAVQSSPTATTCGITGAVHTGRKPYKCDFCPAEFVKTTNKWHHRQAHMAQKTSVIYVLQSSPTATACKFTFSNSLLYRTQVHTGKKPYQYFTYINSLRYHKQVHTGKKPYQCDFCPAEFVKATNLWRHKLTHWGKNHTKFTYSNSLRYHKQVQARSRTSVTSVLQSSSRPQTCDITNRHTLGQKPYKCDLCPAEFTHSNSLQYHRQVHTEFTYSNSLQYHKQVHKGKKPYKCDLSPAEFRGRA